MDKLNILWTTDNKDTIFNMLIMYAVNSIRYSWWEKVNIIIWGASAKLIGNDTQLQTEIIEMLNVGITIEACKDCCENYGVTAKLEKLGISVKYMGETLTNYLKNNEKVLTI